MDKRWRNRKMTVSYDKLWKLLIDKKMNKTQMRLATGISSSTLAKLSKEEPVTLEVLEKICNELHCNIGDIVEFIK
jgi:putative transcriptional regulator